MSTSALLLHKTSSSLLPVVLYLYEFSGWVHRFSGQIGEVQSDDVVETLVSMYGICTASCILFLEA